MHFPNTDCWKNNCSCHLAWQLVTFEVKFCVTINMYILKKNKNDMIYFRGAQILKKSHLKVLGTTMSIWSKFLAQNPQILATIAQNFITTATWWLGFVHPWSGLLLRWCTSMCLDGPRNVTSELSPEAQHLDPDLNSKFRPPNTKGRNNYTVICGQQ
jgi:hypothetical protein